MIRRNQEYEEGQTPVRILDNLEDIVPEQLGDSGLVFKIIKLARGYGLDNMHDVTAEVLNMSKFTELVQVPEGELFTPQMNISVDMNNALEILRMLSAGILTALALLMNNTFRVHWDVQYEQKGLFGETWANGYYHYQAIPGLEDKYVEMIEIYVNHLLTLQDWYISQLGLAD
jgi:hypothetical protein